MIKIFSESRKSNSPAISTKKSPDRSQGSLRNSFRSRMVGSIG